MSMCGVQTPAWYYQVTLWSENPSGADEETSQGINILRSMEKTWRLLIIIENRREAIQVVVEVWDNRNDKVECIPAFVVANLVVEEVVFRGKDLARYSNSKEMGINAPSLIKARLTSNSIKRTI